MTVGVCHGCQPVISASVMTINLLSLSVSWLQVYTLSELQMVAELCKKHDVVVFADEVYEWLVYGSNKHIKIGWSVKTEQNRICFICIHV